MCWIDWLTAIRQAVLADREEIPKRDNLFARAAFLADLELVFFAVGWEFSLILSAQHRLQGRSANDQ
jgi:hypothetical protein